MNKKVWTTALILVIVFLTLQYIAKAFFPEQFVMVIENQRLLNIGNFIDNHKWSYYLFGIITSFLTYWLYLCACCHKKYLKWHECLIILSIIGGSIGLSILNPEMCALYSLVSMLLLPILFKGNCKSALIVFSTHYTAQWLTLKIRNFPMYMTNINSISLFLTNLECIGWLLLFYILFNYKKKEE